MSETDPDIVNELVDSTVLLVRGKNGENKEYIKTLSHAIMTVLSKHGEVSLRSIGASSVNNAVKAITIALGEAKKRNVDLVMTSGFQTAVFDDIQKTAIVFKVFTR
jgi:stage V sporulation protein SpoVS